MTEGTNLDPQQTLLSDKPKETAGYLVVRLKPREGVLIGNEVEVRVTVRTSCECQYSLALAVRAPRHLKVTRVR